MTCVVCCLAHFQQFLVSAHDCSVQYPILEVVTRWDIQQTRLDLRVMSGLVGGPGQPAVLNLVVQRIVTCKGRVTISRPWVNWVGSGYNALVISEIVTEMANR